MIFLDESRAQVNLGCEGGDDKDSRSGAGNHVTCEREAFAELDDSVVGTVKFGDGSMMEINGRDTVLFQCQNGEHRALTDIYFILRLRSSIVRISQLDD